MFKNKIIYTFCFVFLSFALFSQNDTSIKAIARPTNLNKILIRWAPTTPSSFIALNNYGYKLERFTIVSGGQVLSKPLYKNLGTFKPKELNEWADYVSNNDYAAIMAQSIYGDSFVVQGSNSLDQIVNLSKEQQQRFTFGLFVADQDYDVAKFAGLAYEDIDVLPNDKYFYKLTSLVPESELKINSGGVYTSLDEYIPLTKPSSLVAKFDDSFVSLSWDFGVLSSVYTSYFIERSTDGITFNRVNDKPYTSMDYQKGKNVMLTYIDSIRNDVKYHYRIKGNTFFGETGPSSNIVTGMSTKGEQFDFPPEITYRITKNKDKDVLIKWDFPKEDEHKVSKFTLSHSLTDKGPYKTVVNNISPESREVLFKGLSPSNYFIITAIGKSGAYVGSLPSLVQPTDNTPPAKPTGLTAVIDSLGVVSLKWDPNTEVDLRGYRIFRANLKTEELTPVNDDPIDVNFYKDTISLKLLNKNVFYQICALDKRYNRSILSDTLSLRRPDIIPPSAPIIKTFNITSKSVKLTWIDSSSDDVVTHSIYRKYLNKNKDWELVYKTDKLLGTNSYFDTNIESGAIYQYVVRATDESGLLSNIDGNILDIEIPFFQKRPPVSNFQYYSDRENAHVELSWSNYNFPNVLKLSIFKAIKGKQVSLFRTVLPNINKIVDKDVKPNNLYTYIIRPVYKDGVFGKHRTLDVKY